MQNTESADMNNSSGIQDLIFEYARRIDKGDFAGVGELFSRGKIIVDESREIAGAENVCAMYTSTTRRYEDGTPRTHHVTTNTSIDVKGKEASAKSYFTVFQGMEDFPLQVIVTGQYFDSFVLHDDGWWFASRRMELRQVGDVSRHLLIDL